MIINNVWVALTALSFSISATAQPAPPSGEMESAPAPYSSSSATPATVLTPQLHTGQKLPEKEKIPDDIWSTIASPFDPISNTEGLMPQQQRPMAMPMPQPRVEATMQPPIEPQPVYPQPPMSTAPPVQPSRYPVQAVAVPYELPPQEKIVTEYPEEYWNCLLNNLQGLGSDVAAKLITRACQKKYPKQPSIQ